MFGYMNSTIPTTSMVTSLTATEDADENSGAERYPICNSKLVVVDKSVGIRTLLPPTTLELDPMSSGGNRNLVLRVLPRLVILYCILASDRATPSAVTVPDILGAIL